LDYWPKFIYGDVACWMLPHMGILWGHTLVGVGCFTLLESWGLRFPASGLARQKAGLEALREIRDYFCLLSEVQPGLVAARSQGVLEDLTAYDLQVQCCEAKRGMRLPAGIAATRAPLTWAWPGEAQPRHKFKVKAKQKAGRL
jgi:hypothetical protein